MDLATRVKQTVRQLYRDGRFTQTALAKWLHQDPSNAVRYVTGPRPISLKVLEAVSELTQVPVAELVLPPGALLKQVSPQEASLLRWFRGWPEHVRVQLVGLLEYFEQEDLVDRQSRNMQSYWRTSSIKEREMILAFIVMQKEGQLSQDVLDGLVQRFSHDTAAAKVASARKTRRAG